MSDAVLGRASRLPLATRETLDAAAVIGSPINLELLAEVSGATNEAIGGCLASGMLVATGRAYAFRHELARVAIHDAITPPRRRELHAVVLSVLSAAAIADQDVTRLAHHAEAASDREAVLKYAPAAARSAAALGARREATAQYARALRFADDLTAVQRLLLLEEYADAFDLGGWGSASVTTRKEMIELAR